MSEERSSHEVNEKSSGLQCLPRCAQNIPRNPFSPAYRFAKASSSLILCQRIRLTWNWTCFCSREKSWSRCRVILATIPPLGNSHRLPQSSNSPFKWIVYSGCCVLVHIGSSFSFNLNRDSILCVISSFIVSLFVTYIWNINFILSLLWDLFVFLLKIFSLFWKYNKCICINYVSKM